ncbi:hypothetical protein TYRP_015533 [Tyrophagus putrescentiae]|nr:hypothetical protein TYRP_015533 [Tyrophagus putrescentiae]
MASGTFEKENLAQPEGDRKDAPGDDRIAGGTEGGQQVEDKEGQPGGDKGRHDKAHYQRRPALPRLGDLPLVPLRVAGQVDHAHRRVRVVVVVGVIA